MSITVTWDNAQKTVVRWDFDGKWNWQDFAVAQDLSDHLVSSVQHRVAVIGDMRNSPLLPEHALRIYRAAMHRAPQNTGVIVLVGASRFVRAMVLAFKRMIPPGKPGGTFELVDTMEDAYALLDKWQG